MARHFASGSGLVVVVVGVCLLWLCFALFALLLLRLLLPVPGRLLTVVVHLAFSLLLLFGPDFNQIVSPSFNPFQYFVTIFRAPHFASCLSHPLTPTPPAHHNLLASLLLQWSLPAALHERGPLHIQ